MKRNQLKTRNPNCCFSEIQLLTLAATFALSDMGQLVRHDDVEYLMTEDPQRPAHPNQLGSFVNYMCERFMETDEHEEIFYNSGVSWYNQFSQETDLASFREKWRHNTSWLDIIAPLPEKTDA